MVAFLAHQASLENLAVSPLVRDLSLSGTPRSKTAKETAQQLADMLRREPVDTWMEGIAALDTPEYMFTFSGIICTLLTLQASDDQVRQNLYSTCIPRWMLLCQPSWMPSTFPMK